MTIRMKLLLFTAIAVLATVGVSASFTSLVSTTETSAAELQAASKTVTESSMALVSLTARCQAVTLRLLREKDIDALEALVGESEGALRAVQEKLASVGDVGGFVAPAVRDLGAANGQAREALLAGQGAQANQLYIEQSNPAFEKVLEAVKLREAKALTDLDERAIRSKAEVAGTRRLVFGVVAAVVLALLVLGSFISRSIASPRWPRRWRRAT